MTKAVLSFSFIFLCGISITSCRFDETIAEYTNIHDTKSESYVPKGPGDLKITNASDSFIDLNWTDNSLGEKGFIIERFDPSANRYIVIDTTLENETKYTDRFDVKLGVKYYYRIKAFKSQNSSGYSNEAETVVNLDGPTDLKFSPADKFSTAPRISWTGHCKFAQKYIVQWRIAGEDTDFKTLDEVEAGANVYYLQNLNESKVYEFCVSAATDKNVSQSSNVAAVFYGCRLESFQQYSASPQANQVEFSPKSNNFVATCSDYHVSPFTVYNADLQKPVFTLIGGYAGTPVYSPQGDVIALGKSEYTDVLALSCIYIMNAQTGSIQHAVYLTARSLAFSNDGTRLAMGCPATPYGHPNLVGVLDMNTLKPIWTKNSYRITKVKMTPDGKKLIAVQDASESDNIIIFNADDGSVIKTLPSESYTIEDLSLSDDGSLLAFSASGMAGSFIHIYNLNTMTKVSQIRTTATSVAFMHNAKYLAAGSDVVRIFRIPDGVDMGVLDTGFQGYMDIVSLSFNSQDNMLLTGRESRVPTVLKLNFGWRSR
ncbi:MAG TPA: hypothetical protein VHO03_20685 [Ignavibacteriales bacterium]|nr:hypothetical protein [Ignavibacteriales bacterium]